MKRAFGLCLLGAAAVVLSQACGSEDSKKKDPRKTFVGDGGEGGDDGSGGTKNTGAMSGNSGSSVGATSGQGAGGDPTGSTGGTPGMTGDAGATMTGDAGTTGSSAGAGGVSGDDCGPTMGECDGDPETVCEQDLTSPLTCGDCLTSCSSANGNVVCEDLTCKMTSCNANYGDCNTDGTDGCETNLLNNADDCGECGRDCASLGATCNTNRCSTIPLQQDVAGGTDGGGNDMWVYSTDGLMNGGYYDYVIRRYPLSGTGTNNVWVGDNVYLGHRSMLVDGTNLLWAQRGAPDVVMSKPIAAAADVVPTDVFYPEYQPTFLTRQGSAYYWITGDYQATEPAYIYTRLVSAAQNVPGTRIVNVNQGDHGAVRAFAVTSDAIYWYTENDDNDATTDRDLRTTGLNGGTPTSVPMVAGATDAVINNAPYVEPQLQAVGDTLYFSRYVGTSVINGIYRYKTGDAAPTRIVSADAITSLTVDDTYVYYTRQNVAGVWRAPLTIAAPVQISDGNVAKIVAQDADFIYAISSTCCVSDIYKVIK